MAARDDGVSRSVACRVCRVLLTVEASTYPATDHLVEDEGWTRDGDCWLCPRHGTALSAPPVAACGAVQPPGRANTRTSIPARLSKRFPDPSREARP